MDAASCGLALQVAARLGTFREHVKSIMGEEKPAHRLFPVYAGGEGEQRRMLRRRERNGMVSGVGAGALTPRRDGIWLSSTAELPWSVPTGS